MRLLRASISMMIRLSVRRVPLMRASAWMLWRVIWMECLRRRVMQSLELRPLPKLLLLRIYQPDQLRLVPWQPRPLLPNLRLRPLPLLKWPPRPRTTAPSPPLRLPAALVTTTARPISLSRRPERNSLSSRLKWTPTWRQLSRRELIRTRRSKTKVMILSRS